MERRTCYRHIFITTEVQWKHGLHWGNIKNLFCLMGKIHLTAVLLLISWESKHGETNLYSEQYVKHHMSTYFKRGFLEAVKIRVFQMWSRINVKNCKDTISHLYSPMSSKTYTFSSTVLRPWLWINSDITYKPEICFCLSHFFSFDIIF